MPGFRFQPSMVHGLDVRFKLGFLALLGITILNVHLAGLLILALFLLATAAGSRLPVFRLITEFRGFYFLLFFLVIFGFVPTDAVVALISVAAGIFGTIVLKRR